MLPTLSEILQLPAFHGSLVVAGASRLDRVVAWVHIAEILDVSRFLSGGELILTTGLELLRTTPGSQASYLRSLADAGACGLAIELADGIHDPPRELSTVAKELDFPLVVFDQEVRFAELTRAAHQRILQPRAPSCEALGLQCVVDALVETGRDEKFLENQLGPVLALPKRLRGTLVRTLDMLLQARFNVTAAAHQLNVSRQTIYYRLDQLHALLGALDEPDRRTSLTIALAVLQRYAGHK